MCTERLKCGPLNCTLPVVYWIAAALKVIEALRLSGGMESLRSLMNTYMYSCFITACAVQSKRTATRREQYEIHWLFILVLPTVEITRSALKNWQEGE